MNKTEMIDSIAAETGVSKVDVSKVLNAYTSTIVKAVAAGQEYVTVGFGKFYQSERKARPGRNPSTGAVIEIPAAKVPKFAPGKAFKAAVNTPKKPARKTTRRAKK